jgi:SWI/SNF-related matrix-associated actin-dependent regulator 1 of chromatin subfamily A
VSLTFNPRTNEYIITTGDKKRAEEVGLTLSTRVRGPQGEPLYFTNDGYAALAFWRDADDKAKTRLGSLYKDYAASWMTECPTRYEVGQNNTVQREKGLRNYQNAGVSYGLTHPNVLIGDEMGIGKTAQAIAINNAIDAGKSLVICPASIRLAWRKQIKLWSTIPNVRCYPILKSSDGVARWPNYTIISYELARNPDVHAALRAIKWDSLIIDEAHFLKSHSATRTQAIFSGGRKPEIKEGLASSAKRIIALTGTPLPNRPRECFTLAQALCHEAIDWMNYEQFAYRFNPSGRLDNGHNLELKGRLPELHARLRCNFMIRRLKKDVLKELPDKQYEFAYIEPDGALAEVIRKERMLDFDPQRDLKNPMAPIWGEISTVRRQMGEAKLPRAIEHLKYLLDVEEIDKVVVFSHHKSVMDGLRHALGHYGVVEYRGGMSTQAKERNLEDFQTNPKTRIFSGQLDAAGFGVDGLQNVASRVVFVEAAWVPGSNDQAVDRLHRIGQQFPVLAQFLVVEGSLDERILGLVLDKAYTINEVLDMRRAA